MKKEYVIELGEEEADDLMNDHWVGELVRCKDCKHGEPCNEGDVYCNKDIGTFESPVHKPEWFCADGDPKEFT